MRISTSAEYGLRALIHLAEQPNNQAYSLAEIAKAQAISPTYLEKIFGKMRQAGLVRSSKGVNGGYVLARPIESITMKEILEALEGSISLYQPLIEQNNAPKLHCKSHLVLAMVQSKFTQSLDSVKLADLINH